eukprot:3287969-Karenia_brevis.AAC.1
MDIHCHQHLGHGHHMLSVLVITMGPFPIIPHEVSAMSDPVALASKQAKAKSDHIEWEAEGLSKGAGMSYYQYSLCIESISNKISESAH